MMMEEVERRILLAALTALPLLHSHPSATAKLFVDFDGEPAIPDWLGISIPATPAYDNDGNPNDFTTEEINNIKEVWARVAEKYSPFNIDVTTQDPGNRNNFVTCQIVVGGDDTDWLNAGAGGVAPIAGFSNGAPNVGFVFSEEAPDFLQFMAEGTCHEAGHLFNLHHHSIFDQNGTVLQEYDPGNATLSPVMGNSYTTERGIWKNAISDINDKPVMQDDLAILSGPQNRFGYRVDDFGNSRLAATTLSPDLTGAASVKGVIERNTDVDAFNIKSGAGTLKLDLRVAPNGPMLDGSVSVIDPFGTVVAQSATSNLAESLSVQVGGGNYTILVSGAGQYWDLGTYTLDVDVPGGSVSTDHFLLEGTIFDDVITINLVEDAYEVDVNGTITTLDPNTIKFFDILPGDGNDTVTIGPGVCGAYVLGGSGDDTITGGDANDIITGSAGNDLIFGGSGDDRLAGGNGRDYIVAGNGADRCYGDAGNDVITGGAGVDRMFGGSENDVLSGESSADKIYGDAGNDTIYGGRGTDLLNGGDGIDQFWGGDDDDYIYSRDTVIELVNGGAGFDHAQVDETPDHDIRQSLEEFLA